MDIGKIVSSVSHNTCYCQIFGKDETRTNVRPVDYALGSFVGLAQDDGLILVGLLTNTTLFNPDLNSLGPRLTERESLELFAPDYLAERLTLVQVTIIGSLSGDGITSQGCPRISPLIDSVVRLLEDAEIDAFHHPHRRRLTLGYLPLLLAGNDPVMRQVVSDLLAWLSQRYPAEQQRLALLAESIAWKTRIVPLV